ncbi:MAG TPA: hypothetical protein VNQ31_05890 [Sphingomonadaceae bacterium]|nr:hypothetical protein [Sphingomonadaceae bacterium]
MRVTSSLADIDFEVGAIRRENGNLIVEGSPDSTIATTVTITPRDAADAIKRLLLSGATWRFLLSLPFGGGRGGGGSEDRWAERRKRTGINKPW